MKLAFVDQTYMQSLHYGSRRHVRVERLGSLVAEASFEVFVNAVELPVPAACA